MVITLIGLSGCGKSHLARRLVAERGFSLRDCDALIEQRLSREIPGHSFSGLDSVASWMGQPYDAEYLEKQETYLRFEREITGEIISTLGDDGWGLTENIVIDTSGSVIYIGEPLMDALKKRSRLIYLKTPPSKIEFMYEQYIKDPKPVIWKDIFSKREGESNEDAMKRCYPDLLESRSQLYQKYADVTFVIDRKDRDKFSMQQLLKLAGAR